LALDALSFVSDLVKQAGVEALVVQPALESTSA